jgi:hypothetical protein
MSRRARFVGCGYPEPAPDRRNVSTHVIERTSPKGQPFRGTCARCGATGLRIADAGEDCPMDEPLR